MPYIVASRSNKNLLYNLLQDDAPILFEGIHTTAFINHPKLQHRKKIVRLHNIEWEYYRSLFQIATSLKEKIFYAIEFKKLKQYEQQLSHATQLLAIAMQDANYYSNKIPNTTCVYIPAFHSHQTINKQQGLGNYILIHADWSVPTNYIPIINLIKSKLYTIQFPIVIAGKNPNPKLELLIQQYQQIQLISNPTDAALQQLIQQAQLNIVYSNATSGIKIKLLSILFLGRFCLSNHIPPEFNSLIIPFTEDTIIGTIGNYINYPYSEKEQTLRNRILSNFNNRNNAQTIIKQIYKE